MTLLQTRVEDKVARLFKRAARHRNMSQYELLGELVKDAAAMQEPQGWENHRQWLAARRRSPLPKNAVLQTREDEDR